MMGFGFDFNPELKQQFAREWNGRLHSVRMAGLVIGILMLVIGVLCLAFPIQSMYIGVIALTVFIVALGVFEIAEYASLPVYLRAGSLLASGILNIVIGILLMMLPAEGMVVAFSFMLAFNLMMIGVQELSFSSLLRYVEADSYGWVIASGILNIIFSIMLIFIPVTSSVALWIVIALYLIAGGISLLVECIKCKDLKM